MNAMVLEFDGLLGKVKKEEVRCKESDSSLAFRGAIVKETTLYNALG